VASARIAAVGVACARGAAARDGEHRGLPAAILTLASVAGAAGAAITSRAGV
jgi:hypothetical protein